MKPVAIFQHSAGEGPGYFATFLDRHSIPWQLINIAQGVLVPANAGDFSGLALMGGPMSVNDPLPWIGEELTLIRTAREQDIPVIGHCLGGQLMAMAFGATVERNPVKEIGWGEVSVIDNLVARKWFDALLGFSAFHWHGETFSLPEEAVAILTSPYCKHQAFALGPHLGMQCHVEMTAAMITSWCESGAAEIAANISASVQEPRKMLAEMTYRLTPLNTVADLLYTRWIEGLAAFRDS